MRIRTACVVAAVVMAAGLECTAQGGDARAAQVMAQVRKALGGEQKLAAVKSLSLRGSYRRELSMPGAPGGGGNMIITMAGPGGPPPGGGTPQQTGDIEIDLELPDKYIKVDTGTGGMLAMTRTEGFEGDRPFADISSTQPGVRVMAARPGGNDPAGRSAALQRSNEELARFLLGTLGTTQPGFAVTYTYAGQAESPDGKADVIDVAGPNKFAVRLFVDAESHLPLMLTYSAPEPRMIMRTMTPGDAGSRPPQTAGGHGGAAVVAGGRSLDDLPPAEREGIEKAMKDAGEAPAKMVEYRVFFTDFKEVNGISLPHHISRGTTEKTTEEWEVKTYKVNPQLKADRFKVAG